VECGVEILTIYAFSTENRRQPEEAAPSRQRPCAGAAMFSTERGIRP